MNGYYVIPRWVDQLPPKERFIYLELLRLAIFHPAGVQHKEYDRHVPQGAWILSYRQLAELVDIPLPTVHRVIKSLVQKELIEVIELGKLKGKDGTRNRTMFSIVGYAYLQQMGESMERTVEHDMERTMERNEASDTNGLDPSQNVGWNASWNAEWNKKNKGINNEGFKNKGLRTKQPIWLEDQDYLSLKQECGWLARSDEKIYSYFQEVIKERSPEDLKWAWEQYRDDKGNGANLATFLSHEHRNYEQTTSRFNRSGVTKV